MPQAAQKVRGREARGSGADDRGTPHFLARPLHHRHADVRRGIDHEALHRAYRHRRIHRLAPAALLARMRADARAYRREGIALHVAAQRVGAAACGHQGEVGRNVHFARTAVGTGGDEQWLAHPGRTALLAHVRQVFVAEILDRGEHRVRRGLAQAAQRAPLNRRAQRFELLYALLGAATFANIVEDQLHLARAEAARDAFSARLVLGEGHEIAREVDHAGGVVHDDEAARAHDGTCLCQRLVVDRQVHQFRRDAAAGRAAGLRRLEAPAAGDPAADPVHHVAQRHAHRDFDQTGAAHLARDGEGLGAAALLGAVSGEPVRTFAQNSGQIGEGFDVIDIGGLAEQALDRGKRRARHRHPAAPFNAGDERGLLAANKRPRALLDHEVEREAGAEDVLAQQRQRAHLRHRPAQALDCEGILRADVDVAVICADGVGGDAHPFEHGVRIALENRAVHESAGVALVRVADEVLFRSGRGAAEFPLLRRRKPAATAAAQPRTQNFVDHILGLHRQRAPQSLVTGASEVVVDPRRVD